MLAALPTLACVSGLAEPVDDLPEPPAQAGAGISGSGIWQAGSSATAGAASSGGMQSGFGGASTAAGNGTSQAGSVASGGGAGGTKVIEACSFPAWMAGHDYTAGDKVMFMGKAFVANEANPGYDPVISTFFWAPYSCDPIGTGGTGGSGGSGAVINNGDCVLDKLLPEGVRQAPRTAIRPSRPAISRKRRASSTAASSALALRRPKRARTTTRTIAAC